MAEILPTITPLGGGTARVRWAHMAGGDTGGPVTRGLFRGATAHIYGTLVGNVTIEGRAHGAGTWLTLADPQGNPISKGSEAMEEVLEAPGEIRPAVAAGVAADVTVDLILRR